jgi:hypothetical protein
MVSVLASSAVGQLDQTKDDQIGICCFLAKHTASRRNSKDWLARNQDNVSELGTCFSYTKNKVVHNFHRKRFFCLAPLGVRQATRPVTRQK